MAASREDIKRWIKDGLVSQLKMKYLISMCDTFDHDDYPIYAKDDESLLETIKEKDGKNMQKVNEVYLLEEPQVWLDVEADKLIRYDFKLQKNESGLYPWQVEAMEKLASSGDTVVMHLDCKPGSHKQFEARLQAQKKKHNGTINKKTGERN